MATAASTYSRLGYPPAHVVRPADSILRPICVDLDGTLLRTDLLMETFIAAVRSNPLVLLLAPIWLLREGKAGLKAKLAGLVTLDPALLPYHEPLLAFLREKKQAGHKLYLTSAANHRLAEAVADHVGIFNAVLASDASNNLKGLRKLRAIRALLGDEPFVYAGNDRDDLPIWRESQAAITVNPPRSVAVSLRREGIPVIAGFDSSRPRWKAVVKAMRVYQWSKNALIFLPLLLGHALELPRIVSACVAFAAFSLCASAFYVLNDLLDLEADRLHPRKRQRPFASGALSIPVGAAMLAVMVPAVILFSAWIPPAARWLLALYAGVNLLYSVKLKRVLFLDVLVLACFYAMRVLVGGAASGITVSIWTLAFSIFLFLGLALVKRLTELRRAKNQNRRGVARRAYLPIDISLVRSLAGSALYLSVLVLAMYINSSEVHKLYARPEALWFVCLLLIYWVSRILMLANRGKLADDPIVFAFRDRASYYVAALVLVCVVVAA
jgi:4-hydroxybenzoate polyprenyltransferase/phosphoserine phosphatase